MIVIVGGQHRKVGKTTTVCDIIRATTEARWTAIKLTSDSHGVDLNLPVSEEQTSPASDNDTGRYLLAGAAQSIWIRCVPGDIATAIHPFLKGNVVIESNSAAAAIDADLLLLVVDDAESKPSVGAVIARDHIVVRGRVSGQVLTLIQRHLSEPTT